MVAKAGFLRVAQYLVLTLTLALGVNAVAQDELRATFFKNADIAKAAAEAANAELLAPRSFGRGMKEYRDAETALSRGRNIELVRSNAADAARFFDTATEAAQLAATALTQVMKSRQDAANAR
ncbi:MAG: hypothetical protein IIC62_06015, partial [Proteobacteria bacterium]|nr:hypothetical protein [Pseudomonadota bacterium]